MKSLVALFALLIAARFAHAQSFFSNNAYANSPLGVGANAILVEDLYRLSTVPSFLGVGLAQTR